MREEYLTHTFKCGDTNSFPISTSWSDEYMQERMAVRNIELDQHEINCWECQV